MCSDSSRWTDLGGHRKPILLPASGSDVGRNVSPRGSCLSHWTEYEEYEVSSGQPTDRSFRRKQELQEAPPDLQTRLLRNARSSAPPGQRALRDW